MLWLAERAFGVFIFALLADAHINAPPDGTASLANVLLERGLVVANFCGRRPSLGGRRLSRGASGRARGATLSGRWRNTRLVAGLR